MTEISGNICILVMCGIPAAGKSTICQELRKDLHQSHHYLAFTVEYDRLMPKDLEKTLIQNQTDSQTSEWKTYRETIVNCVEGFIEKLQNISDSSTSVTDLIYTSLKKKFDEYIYTQVKQLDNYNDTDILKTSGESGSIDIKPFLNFLTSDKNIVIIIDDNMYYRSMRYDYYQMARKYCIGFCEVYLECSLEEALRRNTLRGDNQVDSETILKMSEKFEIPDGERYKWEKHSFKFTNQFQRSKITNLIEKALKDSVHPVEEIDPEIVDQSRRICSSNILHQADLILRQIISSHMKEAKANGMSSAEMKNLSTKLNNCRSLLLADFKGGNFQIKLSEEEIVNSSLNKDSQLYKVIQSKFDYFYCSTQQT